MLLVFIRSSTWFRRITISAVSGTTRSKSGQSASSETVVLQTSSAFFTRSNLVGDCGMAARIANWASVRSLSALPKYPRAAAFTP